MNKPPDNGCARAQLHLLRPGAKDSAPVEGVHPDFHGLTLEELHRTLSAELALLPREERETKLRAVSWVLGSAWGSRATEAADLLPEVRGLPLEVLHQIGLVPKLEHHIQESNEGRQLPLIGLVKPRKD